MPDAQNASPATSPPRVLVIDDDSNFRKLLRNALEMRGAFEVLVAEDAMAGRARLSEEDFRVDVVLLDLRMPGVGGEELLEWIKAVAPQLTVIVVSGDRHEETVLRCLSKGAIDFLPKPCQLEMVGKTIRRALERQKRINEASGAIQAETPTAGWVELTAPSEMEYLKRFQRFSELLFETSLPHDVAEDMRMIIEEAGRNAIEWGNRFDTNKQFRISYCIFEDRVVLKFEDEGEGFDVSKLRDPTLDPREHIKKRKAEGKRPGGFGVHLLQKLMDDVVYSDKGNVVVMTKRLPAP